MIKRILLAEDDRGTALVVKKQLESKGFHVVTAANGIEALKVLSQQTIDLLITDVVMPKMDGVDLYSAIKKNPLTSKIPIIIVTDKAIFKESFANLGVLNFVEKSTDINHLLDKIKNIENLPNEVKEYQKILISSNHQNILYQMRKSLLGMKYLVTEAMTSDQIFSKALITVPHIVVLDVLFQDTVSASEIIRALRCFTSFKNLKIITYAYFPEDLGIDVEAVQNVEHSMKLCTQAGADLYIGRFNPSFFIERLMDISIKK